jgi:hypothetical protein
MYQDAQLSVFWKRYYELEVISDRKVAPYGNLFPELKSKVVLLIIEHC